MPAKKQKININLEIAYDFHPKPDHCREHWMYFHASGDTHEECKEKAKKHFEAQIRSVGWTKIVTLKEIRPIGRTDDPAKRKSNAELSGSRTPSKSSTSPGRGNKRKPSTGGRKTAKRRSKS